MCLFLNFYRFAFGPQHTASHGVLTCLLYLSNEYIVLSDMIIGYLHRGTEKLCETKKPNQNIPYFDRLDYVSIIFCEHMYVLSYEMLLNNFSCFYNSCLRICLFELTRVLRFVVCFVYAFWHWLYVSVVVVFWRTVQNTEFFWTTSRVAYACSFFNYWRRNISECT